MELTGMFALHSRSMVLLASSRGPAGRLTIDESGMIAKLALEVFSEYNNSHDYKESVIDESGLESLLFSTSEPLDRYLTVVIVDAALMRLDNVRRIMDRNAKNRVVVLVGSERTLARDLGRAVGPYSYQFLQAPDTPALSPDEQQAFKQRLRHVIDSARQIRIEISHTLLRVSAAIPDWLDEDSAAESIADFIRALSDVHRAMGGEGLVVDGMEVESDVLAHA